MKIGRTISKVRIKVIIPDKPPQKFMRKWYQSVRRAVGKVRRGQKRAIGDLSDYLAKIGEPSLQALASWLNPGYRTKTGLSYQAVLKRARVHIREGYPKYQRKTRRAFKTGKDFSRLLRRRRYLAALRIAQLSLPFSGYRKQLRGVAPFATRWLCGDLTVCDLILDEDEVLVGGPVAITRAHRMAEFRNKLINRLCQAGSRIVKARYDQEVMRAENDLTNELVNGFLDPALNLAPFTTGGASRVDYILRHEVLFLEILVSRK